MSGYEEIIKSDNERMESLKESFTENENFDNVNELLELLVKYNKLEEVKELIAYLLDMSKHFPNNERTTYQGNLKRLFNSMAVNINEFKYMNWNYCDNKNKALIMLWKPNLLKGVRFENVDDDEGVATFIKTDTLISKPYANLLSFYQNRLFDVVDEKLEVSTNYGIKNALNCFYLNKPDFVLKLPEWKAEGKNVDNQSFNFNLPNVVVEAVDKMFYSYYNSFFGDSKLKKYLVSCCLYQYLNKQFDTFESLLKSVIAFLQLDLNIPCLLSDKKHSLITYAQIKGQPNIRYYEMLNDVIVGSKSGKVRGTKAKYDKQQKTAYIVTEITPDEHDKLVAELEKMFVEKDYIKLIYTFWNSQLLMRSTCLTGWIMLVLLTHSFYMPKTQYDWVACCYDFETFKKLFVECESVEIGKIDNDEKLRLIDILRNFDA